MTPRVSQRPQRLPMISSSLYAMVLNLLVSALILGVVKSQTANTTEGELSSVQGNQTLLTSTAVYSTLKPDNSTSSLNKDEPFHFQDEFENNQTSGITEDDENFQEQEIMFPGRHCHQEALVLYSQYCGAVFGMAMSSISPENWCVLDHIIMPYDQLSHCLEKSSNQVGCYYPNQNTQDLFIDVHSYYFHNCSKEELLLVDAPQSLVVVLTLIPVSLIPVLVYVVIWKSKVQG